MKKVNHKLTEEEKAKGQFSKTNQPTNEQKAAGHLKKRTLKELLNLSLKGSDESSKEIQKLLAKFLKLSKAEVKTMTFEEAMNLKLIHKTLATGNVQAWKAIMEQVYGQKVNIEGTQKIVVTVKKKE